MSKKCAREDCGKTVYPIEELKCLDKVWHKQCFKCTVCGMTLSMKNYKGYDKKPYCDPHYPKTVASVVADTPEMRRIAENTKNQSNIKYHAEYEKMKGTKIEIADDPELERLKKNTQVQSNVSYHGVLGQKARQEEVRPKEEISPNPTPIYQLVTGNGGVVYGIEFGYNEEKREEEEEGEDEKEEEIDEKNVDDDEENEDYWQIPVIVYPR